MIVAFIEDGYHSVFQRPENDLWEDGVSALKDALKLEAKVTDKIRDIVSVCEDPGESKFNDYHVSIVSTFVLLYLL